MTKAEAGRKGGSVRSERKSAAARRTLAAARLAQARKLIFSGIDIFPEWDADRERKLAEEGAPLAYRTIVLSPQPRKDENANAS
jgi:hypothetical protein